MFVESQNNRCESSNKTIILRKKIETSEDENLYQQFRKEYKKKKIALRKEQYGERRN